MNYEDNLMRYRSIRPGRSKNDPAVTDLRELHLFPNGKICYKIHFEDEVKYLPERLKEIEPNREPSRLFQSQLKISEEKFNHLQEIKTILEYHTFYNQ